MDESCNDCNVSLYLRIENALNMLNCHIDYLSHLKKLVKVSPKPKQYSGFDARSNENFSDYLSIIKKDFDELVSNNHSNQLNFISSNPEIFSNSSNAVSVHEKQSIASNQMVDHLSQDLSSNRKEHIAIALFLDKILGFSYDDPKFKNILNMWKPVKSNNPLCEKQGWRFDILISNSPLSCGIFDDAIQQKLSSNDSVSEIKKHVLRISKNIIADTQCVEKTFANLDKIAIVQSKTIYLVRTIYFLLLMAWHEFKENSEIESKAPKAAENFLTRLEILFTFSAIFAECSVADLNIANSSLAIDYLVLQDSLISFMLGVSERFSLGYQYEKIPNNPYIDMDAVNKHNSDGRIRVADHRCNKDLRTPCVQSYVLMRKTSAEIQSLHYISPVLVITS